MTAFSLFTSKCLYVSTTVGARSRCDVLWLIWLLPPLMMRRTMQWRHTAEYCQCSYSHYMGFIADICPQKHWLLTKCSADDWTHKRKGRNETFKCPILSKMKCFKVRKCCVQYGITGTFEKLYQNLDNIYCANIAFVDARAEYLVGCQQQVQTVQLSSFQLTRQTENMLSTFYFKISNDENSFSQYYI